MESGLRHDVRLGVMIIPLICFDKLSAVIGQTTRSPNLDFSGRAGGIVYSCSWETHCAFGLLYFLDFLILNSFFIQILLLVSYFFLLLQHNFQSSLVEGFFSFSFFWEIFTTLFYAEDQCKNKFDGHHLPLQSPCNLVGNTLKSEKLARILNAYPHSA